MGNDDVVAAERRADPQVWLAETQALAARPDMRDDEPRRPGVVRDLRKVPTPERVVVTQSEEVAELYAALALAQAEPEYGDVEKTKTARVRIKQEKGGGEYTYTYETLKDVIACTRPHLAKHGIAVLQFPFPGDRYVTIRTMLAHKSGQWLANDLSATIPMPDPQAVGSAITYLRRYAQKAILNVAADDEDDDGATASRPDEGAEDSPRPAQRRSAQPAPPSPVGAIVALEEKSGGLLVRLDTGFLCATRSPELATALKAHARAAGTRVELRTRPAPDPSRYAPILEEVTVVAADAQ